MPRFTRGRRAARAALAATLLVVASAALTAAHPSIAVADIDRPGPVPPCPDPPISPSLPPAPVPAGPGDQGASAGTITTTSSTPGAGCGPESFSVSTTGVGQIQVINDPVPNVGAVVTYTGNIDVDVSGSSSEQNVSTAVGSATVQVRGSMPAGVPIIPVTLPIIGPPGNVSLDADVIFAAGISCDLSGSYVRQAGTLTVTATGPCNILLQENLSLGTGPPTTVTVNGHYATLQLTGTTALAGDGQFPAVPSPFADTWVETDFHS